MRIELNLENKTKTKLLTIQLHCIMIDKCSI